MIDQALGTWCQALVRRPGESRACRAENSLGQLEWRSKAGVRGAGRWPGFPPSPGCILPGFGGPSGIRLNARMNHHHTNLPGRPIARRAARRLFTLAAVALGPALVAQAPQTSVPPPKAAVLIVGARILEVSKGRYLAPASILIEDGRIKSVTPEPPAAPPAGTKRLEAAGSVLVPGLIDAHVWAAPTADLDADYFYLMGLAHGVTGYRVLNVRTGWGVAQRGRALSGATLAPRLWTSGRGINQGASPGRWLFDAPDSAAAAEEVAQQVASKVDWIEGFEAVGADIYKAMVAAVRGSTVRVSGQPGAASMSDLVAAGVSSIETLAYPIKPMNGPPDDAWLAAGAKELAALQTRLVRGRVTLVPMMAGAMARAFPDEVARDPALALLPESRRAELTAALRKLPTTEVAQAKRAWTSQADFLKRFVRMGGRVAAGTGFELRGYPVPGVGLHRELAALVRAGLSPAEALRAATVTAAELVGAKAGFAGFSPGTEANFIVVSGDPLKNIEDLANITSVIRAGEVLDVKVLRARAQHAAASRR